MKRPVSSKEDQYCGWSTFVGPSKERMDLVDSSLKVMDVISVFGLYAKFSSTSSSDWQKRGQWPLVKLQIQICACALVNNGI